MDDNVKAFYEYHSGLMEPWDGPAAICFYRWRQIGATHDRNGLRPVRYYVTVDDKIILSSEAGVIDLEPHQILEKGRLSPGKMLLVDLTEGVIIQDEIVKYKMASSNPYRKWLEANRDSLHVQPLEQKEPDVSIVRYQQAFGYTVEEVKQVIGAMAIERKRADSFDGK